MLVEVRCCCDAHLIGWVQLERLPSAWSRVTLALRPIRQDPALSPMPMERLTFDLAPLNVAGPHGLAMGRYLALKSHDYPIEQLRRIQGFREATPDEVEAAG